MNAWTKQPDPMTTEEHQKILEVIEKAEALERAEQERVGQVKYGLDIFLFYSYKKNHNDKAKIPL